jgi:GNAT superfamily N-acetyltransferase
MKPEPPQQETIRLATSPADFDAFAALVTEYVQWCRTRYQDDAWFVDQVFGHQSLATELQALAAKYSPPNGHTFLALQNDTVIGGGAYRTLHDGTCEMKRMYVRTPFAGHGTGRRLCLAIIASARSEGYTQLKLDTGHLLTEAIAMYQSLGFAPCAPYHEYPPELMRNLVFMALPLRPAG